MRGNPTLLGAARMWPTPTEDSATDRSKKYAQGGTPLTMAVREKWDTPSKADAHPRALNRKGGYRGKGQKHLQAQIHNRIEDERKMWPTPTASDEATHENDEKRFQSTAAAVHREDGRGQLNPDWVETLMGFPIGWSDSECAEPEDRDYRTTWQTGEWEKDIPRLTTRKDLRRQRLMALGNAVVSQVAQRIGSCILRAEREGP